MGPSRCPRPDSTTPASDRLGVVGTTGAAAPDRSDTSRPRSQAAPRAGESTMQLPRYRRGYLQGTAKDRQQYPATVASQTASMAAQSSAGMAPSAPIRLDGRQSPT